MRISDWSSDVCSSDLALVGDRQPHLIAQLRKRLVARHLFRKFDGGLFEIADVVLLQLVCKLALGRAATRVPRVLLFIPVLRRSEEHTSELQSLMRISYAVFCLKKKNK